MSHPGAGRGTIAILTGGGDVPGLNPAIRAITIRALREGYRVLGIRRGWAGLVDYVPDRDADNSAHVQELSEAIVNRAGRTGGTFLHTSRTRPSHLPRERVPAHLSGYSEPVNDVTKEVLANLAPLPTSAHPEALRAADYTDAPVFVRGLKPTANNNTGFTPDGNSLPMWFFDLVNLESPDKQMLAAANATFDRTYRTGIGPKTAVGVLSKWAIAGTTLGRVEATRFLVPNQIRALTAERQTAYLGGRPLANRLTLREGPQALDAQRLGRAAEALQLALLQSAPGVPGGEPIIRLFPAWPDEWDAHFTLRARGGFVVTAAKRGGRVESVQLRSEAGSIARLRNPWGTAPVTISRNGKRWQQVKGTLLTFDTDRGEVIELRGN